jgi:hypothetical protein
MFLIPAILFTSSWNGVTVAILRNIFMTSKTSKSLNGEQLKLWSKSSQAVDILFSREFYIGILNLPISSDAGIH